MLIVQRGGRGVAAGVGWGIDPAFELAVIRKEIELKLDESVRFNTDQTAFGVLVRIAFGFPNRGQDHPHGRRSLVRPRECTSTADSSAHSRRRWSGFSLRIFASFRVQVFSNF